MHKSILWTEELATGLAWQDFQHQKFLRLIDNILQSFYEKKGRLDIEEEVKKLLNYVDEHFGLEEKYMTITNYPGTKAHKKLHLEFHQFLLDLDSNDNSVMESARLCNRLSMWFVNHIKTIDVELAEYLKSQPLH